MQAFCLLFQVLQKLGKTVETKDERFEQSASNFYQQQVTWRVEKGPVPEESSGQASHQPAAPSVL